MKGGKNVNCNILTLTAILNFMTTVRFVECSGFVCFSMEVLSLMSNSQAAVDEKKLVF